MANFIVTVKLSKNPNHDPKNKITGVCPLTGDLCTDVTGAHHSTYITNVLTSELARIHFETLGFHVTRIEEVKNES